MGALADAYDEWERLKDRNGRTASDRRQIADGLKDAFERIAREVMSDESGWDDEDWAAWNEIEKL